MEREYALGTPLSQLIKPLLGLFHGLPNARQYRRLLTSSDILPKSATLGMLANLESNRNPEPIN